MASARWMLCVSIAALVAARGLPAYGLGEETIGNKKLSPQNYAEWPGLADVVNDEHRVYHLWVNGNEQCYYSGGAGAVNDVLEKFSKSRLKVHQVVLLAGPLTVGPFDGQATVKVDWRLQIVGGIAASALKRDEKAGEAFELNPTLYVYVTRETDLEAIDFPQKVTLLGPSDLRARYLQDMKTADNRSRGYAASNLAEIDATNPESATAIAALLEEDDPWLVSMALHCLKEFGRHARHLIPQLEKTKLKDPKNAKKLAELIDAIKKSKRAPESEERSDQMTRVDQFLRTRG